MRRFNRSTSCRIYFLVSALLTSFSVGPIAPLSFSASGPSAVSRDGKPPKSKKAAVIEPTRVNNALEKLPLTFEPNLGQLDKSVKFFSRGPDYDLFLTSTEAVFSFSQLNAQESKARSRVSSQAGQSQTTKKKTSVVRMRMVGANAKPRIEGLSPQSAKTNYFIGNDPRAWKTNAPSYQRIKYVEAFPGIDLEFYDNQQDLEYDFIVAPGADPNKIKLEFKGADRIHVDAQGDLIIHTPLGELRQKKPIIYQETMGGRKQVAGGYVVRKRNEVGFSVGVYDITKQLVIDPALVYSTYLGGSVRSAANGIAVYSDPITNTTYAYVIGVTRELDFPTKNAFQPQNNATSESDTVFFAKLNMSASGADSLVFSTYLGGNGTEEGSSIAVDSQGNAYLTGRTSSTNFPLANALQTSGGGVDAFVTKVKADGSALIYSTYLGGSGFDRGNSIAVDAAGNAYVTGDTSSPNFPIQNALQTAVGFHVEAPGIIFVSKIAPPSGGGPATLTYSTYLFGTGRYQDFSSNGIATDSSGNAYVTGVTSSHDFPITANAFQPTNVTGGFGRTCFMTQINTLAVGPASLRYSTYFGGTDSPNGTGDVCRAIAVDAVGNVYVTGTALSRNFPTTPGAFKSVSDDDADAFVAKFDTTKSGSQSLVYSTLLGGHGGRDGADQGWGIAVDAGGNAYVSGFTGTPDFPTVNPVRYYASGIYVTTNEGATVAPLNKGLPYYHFRALEVDTSTVPRTLYTIAADPGNAALYKSTDGGITWQAINSVPTTAINCLKLDPQTPATIYLGTDHGLFKSTNAGDTWASANNGFSDGASTGISGLTFDTTPNSQIIYAGAGDNLYKSTDGGDSWLATGLNGGASTIVINTATTPHTLFSNLQRSTDGGNTWAPTGDFCMANYSDEEPRILAVDSTTFPATIYAYDPEGPLCGTANFVKSTNNGTTWEDVHGTTEADFGVLIPQLVVDTSTSPSTLYRSEYRGIRPGSLSKSADGGSSWARIEEGGNGPFFIDTSSRTIHTPATIYFSLIGILGDSFVSQLNPTGSSLVFSTYLGGGGSSVAVDSQGSIYVAGGSPYSFMPTVNGFQTHPVASYTTYMAKLGSSALPPVSAGAVTTQVAALSSTLTFSFPNITGSTTNAPPSITVTQLDTPATANFSLSNNLGAYEISTTAITNASTSDPIKIAFQLSSINDPAVFNNLQIIHIVNGLPIDVTSSRDFATRTVYAQVTSFSPFIIVKGPTDQIKDLVNLVKSFNLRNGIANSLDSKLQNAEDALTAARSGYRQSACNRISSFLSEVQAQTGKALTSTQAAKLINAANQIRASMSCQ